MQNFADFAKKVLIFVKIADFFPKDDNLGLLGCMCEVLMYGDAKVGRIRPDLIRVRGSGVQVILLFGNRSSRGCR